MTSSSTLAIQRGLALTGWTVDQLWIAVVGVGGGFSWEDVENITTGRRTATPAEHDIVAIAMNDFFVDHHQGHHVVLWKHLAS